MSSPPPTDCPHCGAPATVFRAGVCPRCALARELAAEEPELEPGAVAGYRLREKIGEGGMGEVFLADQIKPVPREVALKRLKHAADGGDWLVRFQHELEALALLDHRYIATVFDAGVAEDGRPFYTMELVEGLPLTLFCDREQISSTHRLRLMKLVCDAVDYAHRRGVWHGDLKPSNILAALTAEKEVDLKLIDFGVRRAAMAGTPGSSRLSAMFTPGYASPESRITGGWDSRSDIYSLGAVLAELTGANPPPSPGAAAAAKRPRGEVDWIVARAMAEDPAARYSSAADMAADITALLTGFPLRAHPPSLRYTLSKFLRRHRRRLLLSGAALLVALVATVAAIAQRASWHRSREALHRVEREARMAVRQTELMQQLVHSVAMIGRAPDQAMRDTGLTHMLAASAEKADRAGAEGDPGTALTLLGAAAAAAAAFERHDLAIAHWRRALTWLDKSGIAASDPRRAGVTGALARSLMAAGDSGEAVELLTGLVEGGSMAALPPQNRLDALTDLAHAHFAGRDFHPAAQWAEKAVAAGEREFGPDHPRTLHAVLLLGKSLTELQRYREAHAALLRSAGGLDRLQSDSPAAKEAAQWLAEVVKVLEDAEEQ